MRKRRLLLATAALATGMACKPRVIHGNTKAPSYPADAGVDSGSAAPDAAAGSADVPKEPEIIHSNPGPSVYDSGLNK